AWLEAVFNVDPQQHAVALRSGDHLLGSRDIDRHRLFDENVLLALQCHARVFGVEPVRSRNIDQVDVTARAQPSSIVIGLRIWKVLAEPVHDLGIDIRRRGNAKVGILDKLRDHGEGCPTEADYANTYNPLARCHLFPPIAQQLRLRLCVFDDYPSSEELSRSARAPGAG